MYGKINWFVFSRFLNLCLDSSQWLNPDSASLTLDRRLRSMEQHKHMLQAYPTPIDKDVFEADAWARKKTDVFERC